MRILITGATRGLGLATARAARTRGVEVVVAGRNQQATESVAAELGADPVHLDLSDLDQVHRSAARLPHLDAVVCNAGLQIVAGLSLTPDGLEETLVVNHLAHLALVDVLLARAAPPRRLVFVSSDTHNPAVRTGTPDPVDAPVAVLARPEPDTGNVRAAGMRRYTTSKQLAAATAAGLARERNDVHVTAFNPGLMPGTGLARQFPPAFRALWATVLKGMVVLPFASSPASSGRALAALACDEPAPAASGTYVDFRLRENSASERAEDPAYQDSVLQESRELLRSLR